jgi:hypothetical protein
VWDHAAARSAAGEPTGFIPAKSGEPTMVKTAYRISETPPRADEAPVEETAITTTAAPHETKTGAPTTDHFDNDAAIGAKIENNAGHTNESKINPVERLMTLRDQVVDIKTLFAEMNKTYAVVKYGSKIVVASIIGKDVDFMTDEDFHKMFANLVVCKKTKHKDGTTTTQPIKVSKRWFEWEDRRYYLGRGVVFEPGGPPEIPNDTLNVWRGFGIVPKLGMWSLMSAHILNVVCSGQQKHFDYLIRWMSRLHFLVRKGQARVLSPAHLASSSENTSPISPTLTSSQAASMQA